MINVTWKQLGIFERTDAHYEIFDVLQQDKINRTNSGGLFEANVPSHDVAFVIVSHNVHRH